MTTIYITHTHADHYFGLERLLERFPQARAVALPSVAAAIKAGNEAQRNSGGSSSTARHWTTLSSPTPSRATRS
ncbi:hypothetical protein [Streptomyces sp. DT2A-34]|uniref:hypothetical protein n=1 Tax=Streptomyces sp. DT2A-34 TaxID=3051182 RepID=UPI003464A375